MGVSVTRTVKYILKGDKGEKGASLRGPQAWSDCAVGYSFQAGNNGDDYKDLIMYGNNYYTCIRDHAKTATNYPTSTEDNNNGYWQLGDKVDLIATKVLLAAFALVGGAVFDGDYMYSQQGKNASGNATSDYTLFDASKLGMSDCPFTPNLYFNYKTGDSYQANGTFSGMVKASSLYTPFKDIALNGGGTYNYNPSTDGNFIRVYASGYSGGYVTINMPNASTWSGAHLFIRVPEIIGTTATITTIYASSGFKFPLGKTPIDSYQDSTSTLHPQGGIFEFISDGTNWIPSNYNVNIGPLVHSGQYLSYSDTSLTILPTTTYVRCNNNNTAYVSLPSHPIPWQEVKVFRAGGGTVVIQGNGHSIFAAENTVSSVSMAHINELDYFIFNGTTWDYSYGNWN